jgi:hypothetical protein
VSANYAFPQSLDEGVERKQINYAKKKEKSFHLRVKSHGMITVNPNMPDVQWLEILFSTA